VVLVLLVGCATTAQLPSPSPGVSSYTLKIEAVGMRPVSLAGHYSVDGSGSPVDLSGQRTPYAATVSGRTFEGTFSAADSGRRIKVLLFDSEEKTSGPAATGKGHEVSMRWARPGAGPRDVKTR
jgi:hypothetical protein